MAKWERIGLAAALLVAGLAALISFVKPEAAQLEWWQARFGQTPAIEKHQYKHNGPAPTLKKGPKVKVRGKIMASWKATGAGDATYDGIYTESGTHGGKPAYTNGSRWLWWYALGSQWVLSTAVGSYDVTGYYSDADDLPANPWQVLAGSTTPAPTLAEAIYINPPPGDWSRPYPTYWWQGWNEYPGWMWLQPARCFLGSPAIEYVAFPYRGPTVGGFRLFDVSAKTWHDCPLASGQLFAVWNDSQGGAVFDAGDGTHLYAFSGPYLDSGTPKFQCKKFALVVDVSATEVV